MQTYDQTLGISLIKKTISLWLIIIDIDEFIYTLLISSKFFLFKLINFTHSISNRSFCPDRTLVEARRYIASSQGERFTEAVILDFELMLEESNPRIPLIGLLSMGSDPTKEIENMAKRMELGKL